MMGTDWIEGLPTEDGCYLTTYRWRVGKDTGRAWDIVWCERGVVVDTDGIPLDNTSNITHHMRIEIPSPPGGGQWGD